MTCVHDIADPTGGRTSSEAPTDGAPPAWASIGAWLCLMVIGAAGALKLADLAAFRASLETWTLLPVWSRSTLTVLVPVAELTLAVCWGLGLGRRAVAWAGLALLGAFTAAYLVHAVLLSPPACQCLGKLLAFEQDRASSYWTVGRNAVLAMGLTPYAAAAGPAGPRRARRAARGGFTLVELLVVMAIVTLLVAMSSTGLGRVRQQARLNQSLARFASAQKAVAAYSADAKESFPLFMPPSTRRLNFTVRGFDVEVGYYEQYTYWHYFLAESYLGVPWDSPSLQATGSAGALATGIWYPHVFVSSPESWSDSAPPAATTRRATRVPDVTFPASKLGFVLAPGVNLVRPIDPLAPPLIYSACDGSAGSRPFGAFARGLMPLPDALADGAPSLVWPGLGTAGGLRGRDLNP